MNGFARRLVLEQRHKGNAVLRIDKHEKHLHWKIAHPGAHTNYDGIPYRLRNLSKPLEHLKKRWCFFYSVEPELNVSETKCTNKVISRFATRHLRAKFKIIHFLASFFFFYQTFGYCSPILQWSKISETKRTRQVKTSEMLSSYLHQNRKRKTPFLVFHWLQNILEYKSKSVSNTISRNGRVKKRTRPGCSKAG